MAGWWWALAVGVTLLRAGLGSPLPQAGSSDGAQMIGAACSSPADCNQIQNGQCNTTRAACECLKTHPIPNGDACLKVSGVTEGCVTTAQCRPKVTNAECADGVCSCRAKHYQHNYADGTKLCFRNPSGDGETKKTPVDPVMIGILVSLVLMFLIICIVLQLFSKARFRQNRTILNSANPRLMNASFLKGQQGKGAAGQSRGHRGSRGSLEQQADDSSERGRRDSPDTDRRQGGLAGGRGGDGSQMTIEVAGSEP